MAGRPTVAIVGGSIGGLTAAVLLRDLGFDVTVYERSPSPLEGRGAGIVVHPMTVRYLVEHGVDLESISCGSRALRYLAADGSVVFEEPSGYRFTAWNALYGALRAALGPDRYQLGAALTALEVDGPTARLVINDHDHVECDLAVCADGYASSARAILLPECRPRYSGYVGWRGMVPLTSASSAARSALEQAVTFQVMQASHIVMYPIPGLDGGIGDDDLQFNYVWYLNVPAGPDLNGHLTGVDGRERDSVPPGLVRPEYVRQMRATSDELGMAPALKQVVIRTAEPFIQKIVDCEVPRMVFGRVCLMGDAAFACRPHAAAGTAKAAADAWALAGALEASGGDIDRALTAWEPAQLALGRQLVARTRDLGDRSQRYGTWIPGDPSLKYGLWAPGD